MKGSKTHTFDFALIHTSIFPFTEVHLSSVLLLAAVVNRFCFCSSRRVRSAFCFLPRTWRLQKQWDSKQHGCTQERGQNDSIHYQPSKQDFAGEEWAINHRAAVPWLTASPKYLTWVPAPSGWVAKDFALRNRHRLFFIHYVVLCCLL